MKGRDSLRLHTGNSNTFTMHSFTCLLVMFFNLIILSEIQLLHVLRKIILFRIEETIFRGIITISIKFVNGIIAYILG